MCVCVCVHALRIVSRDKILSFKNTLIIINYSVVSLVLRWLSMPQLQGDVPPDPCVHTERSCPPHPTTIMIPFFTCQLCGSCSQGDVPPDPCVHTERSCPPNPSRIMIPFFTCCWELCCSQGEVPPDLYVHTEGSCPPHPSHSHFPCQGLPAVLILFTDPGQQV